MQPESLTEKRTAAPSEEAVPVLQLGMGWFPEQGGGLNRMYYNLMRVLPDAGIASHGVVAGRCSGERAVECFAPADASLLTRIAAVRQRVQDLAPYDVVASHFALYTAPVLGRLGDVPLVVHFHGPWADEGLVEGDGSVAHRMKFEVERRVYRRAERFIALSEAFRRVLVERFGVRPEAVSVVPGGVDHDRFSLPLPREEARERLGLPLDRPLVLAVRRLARRMGLQALISATERVRRGVPDVLVLIAGRGPLAGDLQAQIEASGLKHHVRLIGFVSDTDLPLLYRAADLSVVPSMALEGFGLVAAESLAAGTPPLVTPVGGLPEVVRDLSEALVLPATGAEALAGGITSALTGALVLPDPEACQRFAARYDWPVIADEVARVYRAVR